MMNRYLRVGLLTEPLHKLFVFVEFLQGFNIHARESIGFGFITVRIVTKNTHLQLGARDVAKPTHTHR